MIKTQTYRIANGIEIAARTIERGPCWLLCMHGIQSNKDLFADLIEQPFLSSLSLIAIDLVGFGESSKPTDYSYDVQEQANNIEELISDLKVDRLHVIGHSLGGMIGTLLLEPLKNKVQSFINMEGNLVLADCGLSKEVADQPFPEFQNQYAAIKSKIRNSKIVGCLDRAKWLDQIPDFVFYKTSVSIVDWSASGRLLQMFEEATCQKLFIYGSENSKKADNLSKAIMKVEIPNSGHFMLQSNPLACYQKIQHFYESIA